MVDFQWPSVSCNPDFKVMHLMLNISETVRDTDIVTMIIYYYTNRDLHTPYSVVLFWMTLVRALVVSKVDYCSSVLAGISGALLQRLQSVLNAAAHLVFSARKSEHITPLLRELHWLRVPEKIQFRLCVLVHHCLNGTAPSYLAETLQKVCWRKCTSATPVCCHVTLVVPPTRRAILGDRAFPVAAARAWNALPLSVRAVPSLLLFRRELKTTLFRASYAWRLRYSCY